MIDFLLGSLINDITICNGGGGGVGGLHCVLKLGSTFPGNRETNA